MKHLSKEQINKILAASGSKNTRPRRAVAQVLAASDKPFTAGEIFRKINSDRPEINLSTVYRTLNCTAFARNARQFLSVFQTIDSDN